MEQIMENVSVKREMKRFMNRFFTSREENIQNLAEMYYYLEDFINYVNGIQADIGTKLLEKDFNKVVLEEQGVKVFLDKELMSILVDKLTKKDYEDLDAWRNKEYIEKLKKEQKRN